MKIKELSDYLDRMHEKYPAYPKPVLKKILTHGLKKYVRFNVMGCDFASTNSTYYRFSVLTMRLYKDMLRLYKYKLKKMRMKERIMFYEKRCQWDGYYYFGLTRNQHLDFVKELNSNKRIIFIKRNVLYKLYRLVTPNHANSYIYRIKLPIDFGFAVYFENHKVKKDTIEYVGINKESKWIRQQTLLNRD